MIPRESYIFRTSFTCNDVTRGVVGVIALVYVVVVAAVGLEVDRGHGLGFVGVGFIYL